MKIVPFDVEHLQGLRLQPVQAGSPLVTPETAGLLGNAFTALSEGVPVACGGLYEIWPNRALAWTYLGADCGREFMALHRVVRRHLDFAPWRRVEAYVEAGYTNGHRWVRALGFQLEGVLRGFMADGRDMALYARVR
jgi:hypothetical protein